MFVCLPFCVVVIFSFFRRTARSNHKGHQGGLPFELVAVTVFVGASGGVLERIPQFDCLEAVTFVERNVPWVGRLEVARNV